MFADDPALKGEFQWKPTTAPAVAPSTATAEASSGATLVVGLVVLGLVGGMLLWRGRSSAGSLPPLRPS